MGKKALVVDDDEYNLLLEKDLLEVAGFEVFEAELPVALTSPREKNQMS